MNGRANSKRLLYCHAARPSPRRAGLAILGLMEELGLEAEDPPHPQGGQNPCCSLEGCLDRVAFRFLLSPWSHPGSRHYLEPSSLHI